MREKGFLDAEIAVDTRPTYGDRRLTLEFTITEGKTIPPSNLGSALKSPAERCSR